MIHRTRPPALDQAKSPTITILTFGYKFGDFLFSCFYSLTASVLGSKLSNVGVSKWAGNELPPKDTLLLADVDDDGLFKILGERGLMDKLNRVCKCVISSTASSG